MIDRDLLTHDFKFGTKAVGKIDIISTAFDRKENKDTCSK